MEKAVTAVEKPKRARKTRELAPMAGNLEEKREI